MNVIVLLIDGARNDRLLDFPKFKALAERGSFFPNFITHAPYTVASVFSFMTGMYGMQTGVDNYYGSALFRKDECRTLAEHLRNAGYFTRGDTLSDIVCPLQGFDELSIHDENADNLGEIHRRILQDMKKKSDDGQKFFCFLHYSKIHADVKEKILKQFTNYSKEFFDNKEYYEAQYNKYFKEADEYLGGLTAEIENLGLFENSIVILFSDHGMSVGDKFGEKAYGSFCYDYTLKTFCAFIKNGVFPEKRFDELVRNIDVAPTVLDALGLEENPKQEKISGKSILPIVRGKEKNGRIAFSETGNRYKNKEPPKKPNIKCIRTQNWKLIYNSVPNTFELYNLEADPKEEKNLAESLPEKKEEILEKARQELGFDPLEEY